MKRSFLCIALALMLILISMPVSMAEVGGKLVIWEHTSQFEGAGKAVIEGFKAKYPNVEIDFQVKTSDQYYNLLATAIQAGEAPDLFWTNGTLTTNMAAYVEQGLLMDLTDVVDLSLFSESTLKISKVNDRYWSSPTAEVGGRAAFYNKDIFEKLGLSIPKTFDEFEAMLKTIQDAGIIPIAFSGVDPWCGLFFFEPVLAGMNIDYIKEYMDGKAVAMNDPRVVAAQDKIVDWGKKGYFGVGYTGVDGSGAILAFSKGEAAMTVDGTWNIATISKNNPDLNYGAFQIPTADGVVPFVGTPSNGFSISATTKNPEAAIAFENYFASLEGQTLWIKTLDSIPSVSAIVSENPVVNDIAKFDIMLESWYNMLVAQAAEGEAPGQVWEEDQTKVWSGGLTPQQLMDELQELEKQ